MSVLVFKLPVWNLQGTRVTSPVLKKDLSVPSI